MCYYYKNKHKQRDADRKSDKGRSCPSTRMYDSYDSLQ